MEIVVVSSAHDSQNEIQEVIRMFESGLSYFHVRKPRKNKKELAEYLLSFPEKYRKKMVLHSYHGLADIYKLGGIHLSRKHRKRGWFFHFKIRIKRYFRRDLILSRTFHKLTDITSDSRKYSYAFLSPVFDSITHSTLSGGFSKRALLIMLPQAKQPVYAMGGVTIEKIPSIAELGFEGLVLVGSVWNNDQKLPHQIFKEALAAVRAVTESKGQS